MNDDTTLHFDHVATHPALVYVPQHVMNHATPLDGVAVIILGVLFAGGAYALFSGSEIRRAKRIGVVLGLMATLAFVGGAHRISSKGGAFVGYLPDKTQMMASSIPGDDRHKFFFSQKEALKEARETSRDQDLPESTARTAAVRWNDVPADDRNFAPENTLSPFPNDAGWQKKDSLVVRNYLEKSYGITLTHTDQNEIQNYQEVVSTQPSSVDSGDIDHSTLVDVPGNPLRVEGEYEHYRCVLHLEQYRHNDAYQPVSAKPGKVECFSSYDTRNINSHTRRVFPQKIR